MLHLFKFSLIWPALMATHCRATVWRLVGLCLLTPLLFACASSDTAGSIQQNLEPAQAPTRDVTRYLPRIGGNTEKVEALSSVELEHLRLVSIDLVSALVQLPSVSPTTVTLQVTPPQTAFGNLVVRALEDAGYGLQRVTADQGLHYVQYSERYAETDAGPVSDYVLRVGEIELDRDYIVNEDGIFPSSLMRLEGVDSSDQITLDESIFKEQGGRGQIFLSGVASGRELNDVREFSAMEYDKTPLGQRRTRAEQLLAARRSAIAKVVSGDDLNAYERLRRTVLIFDNPETRIMGAGNKQAVRLLVREYQPGDIFQIAACADVDGKNEASASRGIRVVEEFLSYNIPLDSVVRAECRRASFRHPADKSPIAVEIVHHRIPSP